MRLPRLYATLLCFLALLSTSKGSNHTTPGSDQMILPHVIIEKESVGPDLIAVLPDRSTAYPNGVHNGLLITARRLNLTIDVRAVGNFDPEISAKVLTELINLPTNQRPKLYLIWPIDFESRMLLKELWDLQSIPIIQMNQLPADDAQWEWDHLVGYAGPDDALRASNAGIMVQMALEERQLNNSQVVALGYPKTYGGYHLSIAAFERAIANNTNINLKEKLPLPWGPQSAYEATLNLLDTHGSSIDAIYAMDDSILNGAYQAIKDHPLQTTITLVGTVCNGARELLETEAQFGTTVQGPYLEGALAVQTASEYIQNGFLQEPKIRFTPNPMVTAETWETLYIDFLEESYTADELCTWTVPYERSAGVLQVESVDDVCAIVTCDYIPRALLYTGIAMCLVNYGLAVVSFIGLYVYRNRPIVQLAQPVFLALVIFGTMIDNSSILLFSQDNYDRESSPDNLDAVCFAIPWVLGLGHMCTTATLVAKIYRVKKILVGARGRGGARKAQKVTITSVAFFIVLFLSVDVIILTAWSLVDPMQWNVLVSSYDQTGYIGGARATCSWSSEYGFLFPLGISLFHLSALIYANVLAYQTSDYHKISDSKNVAIALFNSIQLLVIVSPLLVVVGDNVGVSYFIKTCFVFLNNFGVLALVVAPKLWQCLRGHGDDLPDMHAMTTRAAGRRSSAVRVSGIQPSRQGISDSVFSQSINVSDKNNFNEHHPLYMSHASQVSGEESSDNARKEQGPVSNVSLTDGRYKKDAKEVKWEDPSTAIGPPADPGNESGTAEGQERITARTSINRSSASSIEFFDESNANIGSEGEEREPVVEDAKRLQTDNAAGEDTAAGK